MTETDTEFPRGFPEEGVQELPPPPAPDPETLSKPDSENPEEPYERFRSKPETAEETQPEIPDFTIEDVAAFGYERQAIWHRRFVEERPEPWTDDETLRHWRICNIYRELDRGTQYMREHVAERRDESGELYPTRERLVNTVFYRLLNRTESWERHVGWLEEPYTQSIAEAGERLAAAFEAGEVIRTSAFRVGNLAEMIRSCQLVAEGLDELDALCQASSSLKMVHALLGRGYEIGDFTAYQVALDLQFVYPNLDNSDWVFVGGRSSSRRNEHGGSMWALRKLAEHPDEQPVDVCRRLRDTQDEWLPDEWGEVAWPERPRLSICDVDNLMCEFRKYWFKRHGKGALRKFGDGPEPEQTTRRRRGKRGGGRGDSNLWETPPSLFAQLDEEFHFTIDAAATLESTKLERFWSPAEDALRQSWAGERVFCFPPTSDLDVWTQKAAREADRAELIVMLLPAATETKWWHFNVVGKAKIARFVKGKMLFFEKGEQRDKTFGNGVVVVGWWPGEQDGLHVEWGYTWPDRPRVHRSGWTGV